MGMSLEEPNRKVPDHLWESEGHLWAMGKLWGALTCKLWRTVVSPVVFRGMARREAELEAGGLLQGLL